MTITTAELRQDPDRFLKFAQTQDVVVTKDGNPIARITGAAITKEERLDALNRLAGIIAGSEMDADQIKDERLSGI